MCLKIMHLLLLLSSIDVFDGKMPAINFCPNFPFLFLIYFSFVFINFIVNLYFILFYFIFKNMKLSESDILRPKDGSKSVLNNCQFKGELESLESLEFVGIIGIVCDIKFVTEFPPSIAHFAFLGKSREFSKNCRQSLQ